MNADQSVTGSDSHRDEDLMFLTVSRPKGRLPKIPMQTILHIDDYEREEIPKRAVRSTKGSTDPKAKGLHPEARIIYSSANTSYLKAGGKKQCIPINSGLRKSAKQLEFFQRYVHSEYYGGEYWPPTNRPGQSVHEFGLAIDVDLKGDKRKIVRALEDSGFAQTKDHEPWHFEAINTKGFKGCASVMQELRSQSADLAKEVGEWFEVRKTAIEVQKEYNDEREKLAPEERRLAKEKSALSDMNEDLTDTKKRNDSESASIRDDERANSALRRTIDSMVYKDCPEGFPYSECNHPVYKARYDRKKRTMEDKWSSENNSLRKRMDSLRRSMDRYNEDMSEYRRRLSRFKSDEREFKRESRRLRELRIRFSKLRAKMNKSKTAQRKMATAIQGRIDRFLKSSVP